MRHTALIVCTCVALLLAVGTASSQHNVATKFDPTKPLRLTGTVTQIDWATPYVHILFKVPGQGNALPALWAVEVESPTELMKNGWTVENLPIGDTITVEGWAARNGSNQVSGNSVTRGNGLKVYTGINGPPKPRAIATGPAPRWPNGQIRLGAPAGETGYWGNPSRTYMVEDGVNVEMDKYGMLKNIADVSKVAPMQQWARDLYEWRQRDFLQHDPLFLACMPPGGPRQYQLPIGFQFVEQPAFSRVFVLMGDANRNRRTIYTDGRQQIGQLGGDHDNPLYYGRPVAKWEGDTWVVDSIGFNEKFWFDSGGLPHTEKLHLIERFTRVDMRTMRYEVTIDDPGAYTRTWKSTWTLEWIPGEEPAYFLCQDNRP